MSRYKNRRWEEYAICFTMLAIVIGVAVWALHTPPRVHYKLVPVEEPLIWKSAPDFEESP